MNFRTGFVVGKFSPLHRGHMYLLETAQAACAQLYVFSYSKPEMLHCNSAQRISWMKELFPDVFHFAIDDAFLQMRFGFKGGPNEVPHNDAPPEVHRRFCAFLCSQLIPEPVDAVFSSETYGEPLAQTLSQFGSWTRSPVVTSVIVDLNRQRFPISATQLRADFWNKTNFVPHCVKQSFTQRICFLGGESTGKTSLVDSCSQIFACPQVNEYGRTLWEEKKGALDFQDMLQIARKHITNEELALGAGKPFVFVDTSPLTTLFYSHFLFNKADIELTCLASRNYDHVFLCAPDFPFVQDGTRQTESFRLEQDAWYREFLNQKGVAFVDLRGSLEQRLKVVHSILGPIIT